MEHLLNFVLDVTKSVAFHGFKRILIADGHGSNMPILELVARRTNLETESLCAAFIWPSLASEKSVPCESRNAVACPTPVSWKPPSILHLDSERVHMDQAVKEMEMPQSEFIWLDLLEGRLFDSWTTGQGSARQESMETRPWRQLKRVESSLRPSSKPFCGLSENSRIVRVANGLIIIPDREKH